MHHFVDQSWWRVEGQIAKKLEKILKEVRRSICAIVYNYNKINLETISCMRACILEKNIPFYNG